MHPKAAENLFKRIFGALQHVSVVKGFIDYDSLKDLYSIVPEKQIADWINPEEIVSLIAVITNGRLVSNASFHDAADGTLVRDLLGEEALRNISTDVVGLLNSIPRENAVSLPLPRLQFQEPFDVTSNGLRLFSESSPPELGLLSLRKKPAANHVLNVGIGCRGYASGSIESSAVSAGVDMLKVVLNAWITKGFMVVSRYRISNDGSLFNATDDHIIEKMHVCVNSLISNNKILIPLPIDFSATLSSIEWGAELQRLSLNERIPFLVHQSASVLALLENLTDEAKSIRSAAEWCFNSYLGDNDTLSFLQVCFGLEALFGDGASDGVTKSLATRAAFVIATRISDRATIAARFSELYKVRSAIVHGRVSRLKPAQLEHFFWARALLSTGIEVEARRL